MKMQSPKVQLSPSFSNQTWTKMYLCNGSHGFLSTLHPWLPDSAPAELTCHTVSFGAIKLQDAQIEVLVRGCFVLFWFFFEKLNFWKHNVDFYKTSKQLKKTEVNKKFVY